MIPFTLLLTIAIAATDAFTLSRHPKCLLGRAGCSLRLKEGPELPRSRCKEMPSRLQVGLLSPLFSSSAPTQQAEQQKKGGEIQKIPYTAFSAIVLILASAYTLLVVPIKRMLPSSMGGQSSLTFLRAQRVVVSKDGEAKNRSASGVLFQLSSAIKASFAWAITQPSVTPKKLKNLSGSSSKRLISSTPMAVKPLARTDARSQRFVASDANIALVLGKRIDSNSGTWWRWESLPKTAISTSNSSQAAALNKAASEEVITARKLTELKLQELDLLEQSRRRQQVQDTRFGPKLLLNSDASADRINASVYLRPLPVVAESQEKRKLPQVTSAQPRPIVAKAITKEPLDLQTSLKAKPNKSLRVADTVVGLTETPSIRQPQPMKLAKAAQVSSADQPTNNVKLANKTTERVTLDNRKVSTAVTSDASSKPPKVPLQPSSEAPVVTKNLSTPASTIIPHVVVVGGGWSGWAAAKSLREMGCKVTLVDATPPPTNFSVNSSTAASDLFPTMNNKRKPFEYGTKGFWKDYPNIYRLQRDLGLSERKTFTPCTQSSFYGPYGLEATAPVFSDSSFPTLPSPLGQIYASNKLFTRLPVLDRLSIAGLLYAMLDFSRNEDVFQEYDKMTAHELFIRCGVSKRLVNDFLKPTLLVGLFKPPEELSAAVTLELLYFYALAHQDSFDVKWIKSQSIQSLLIQPLAQRLLKDGPDNQFTWLSGYKVDALSLNMSQQPQHSSDVVRRRVQKVILTPTTSKPLKATETNATTIEDVDACVLAVGAKGLKSILANCPEVAAIAPELTAAASIKGVDVIACRLWLDRFVPTATPANVLSNLPGLRGAGGTFFMLDQLQRDTLPELWGDETVQGSVLSVDFYNAGGLLPLKDQDLVDLIMKDLLPRAIPAFREAKVVDAIVAKVPEGVTWFGPGTYAKRPPLMVDSIANIAIAGDWVKMGKFEHGSKGLCQERAFVSGIEAANSLARSGALGPSMRSKRSSVLPVRDDEIQVKLGRASNDMVKSMMMPGERDR